MILDVALARFLPHDWEIALDYLQDHDVPLADVLLWYARLDEPEGPPTLLAGEYSLRASPGRECHRERAKAVKGHRLWYDAPNWFVSWPNVWRFTGIAISSHYEPAPARRELKRYVLALFPEVEVWREWHVGYTDFCRITPLLDDWSPTNDLFREPNAYVVEIGTGPRREVIRSPFEWRQGEGGTHTFRKLVPAPDLIPPEPADYGLPVRIEPGVPPLTADEHARWLRDELPTSLFGMRCHVFPQAVPSGQVLRFDDQLYFHSQEDLMRFAHTVRELPRDRMPAWLPWVGLPLIRDPGHVVVSDEPF